VEAAGIEPAPGGAKLPAESRPYLVTARNAWESSSRRVPSCPALFRPIPHAPATYVQHGGGRPHPAARHPGMWCSLLPLLSCTCNSLPLPGSCAGAAAAGSIGYNCCEGSTGAIPQAPVEVRAAWIPGPPPAMSKRSLLLPRRLVDGDVSTLADGHHAGGGVPPWVMGRGPGRGCSWVTEGVSGDRKED